MNLKDFFKSVCENPNADIDLMVHKLNVYYVGRAYHNLQHVQECIRTFNLLALKSDDLLDPDLIKLALIFHDVICTAGADDNEERSANLADEWMKMLGLSAFDRDIVTVAIEMTSHSKTDFELLLTSRERALVYEISAIVCDCDLSILAAPKERFEEYEREIREEYKNIPYNIFCDKRAIIMKRFLDRSRIYLTDEYYFAFEGKARKNLSKYELVTMPYEG